MFKNELDEKGYCIIPDVLSETDINICKESFKKWQNTIPNHDLIHEIINPKGIYKYHKVGHTYHAWYIRTRPSIQSIFKELWNTDELVVSFDGACYISKNCVKKDSCWTHTDQSPLMDGLKCYQGLVALTDNKDKTLVVYEGTHKLHNTYFTERDITDKRNFQLIDETYLNEIQHLKRVLHVKAGSLVIWDSRTFHQNQYGTPSEEERIVQYVCYLPKSHPENTEYMSEKRKKYFQERRTTTHWPAPIQAIPTIMPLCIDTKIKEQLDIPITGNPASHEQDLSSLYNQITDLL